jgi:hypothetical protein
VISPRPAGSSPHDAGTAAARFGFPGAAGAAGFGGALWWDPIGR